MRWTMRLRKALEKFYPQLREVKLLDYKVRVLAANRGTESKVRVLIESGDHKDKWGTVGVSENIMEATWQAWLTASNINFWRSGLEHFRKHSPNIYS